MTVSTQPKIESIRVIHRLDESPDTSHIGEYTDKQSEWAILRSKGEYVANLPEDFEMPRRGREYLFFVPCGGYEKPGTKEYQEYGKQDFARMEDFNNGGWHYIGVIAEAEVSYPCGNNSRRIQRLSSGGLWGVESDAGDYLKEIAKQELDDLKSHLEAFNVDLSNFEELAEEAETVSKY